jgi:Predicted methyltransferase
MKVHIENTYFSARLATERARVASLVKQGEVVLVMFSGIAPYPLNIAKAAKPTRIVGIEINPNSHALALDNLELNKKISAKIELHCGDVRKVIPKLKAQFDRIIMPLPKDAEEFLDVALPAAKPGAELNVYIFCKEEEISSAGKKVVDVCKSLGRDATLLNTVRCGQSGVREYRVCVDVRLND